MAAGFFSRIKQVVRKIAKTKRIQQIVAKIFDSCINMSNQWDEFV